MLNIEGERAVVVRVAFAAAEIITALADCARRPLDNLTAGETVCREVFKWCRAVRSDVP